MKYNYKHTRFSPFFCNIAAIVFLFVIPFAVQAESAPNADMKSVPNDDSGTITGAIQLTAGFTSPATDTTGSIDAPRLYYPPDGSVDVPVKPVLRWQSVPDAGSYRIQIAGSAGFDDILTDSSGIGSPFFETDSLKFQQKYHWRVRSLQEGRQGPWSEIHTFTTVIEAPEITQLTSPRMDEINVLVTPKLTWKAAERAEKYRLQISGSPDFQEIVFESEAAPIEIMSDRLENRKQYYWRVRAENTGGAGPWSDTGSFETIIAAPSVPAAVVPHHAARHVTVQPELGWLESERAEYYRVQVAADEVFDSLLIDISEIRENALLVDSLSHFTPHYWRVQAVNIGGRSAWSRAFMFTTIAERPARPGLLSPPADTLHQPVSPQMKWSKTDRAVTYRFQLSKTSDFRNILYDESGISDTLYTVFFLDHLTPYYWRIRASNIGGFSDWSEPRRFTTIIAPPGKPQIITPRGHDIHIPVDLTTSWTRPERAESYHVQVSRTTDFRFPSVGREGVRDTSTFITGLDHDENFWLRVRAVNIGGAGEWSEPVPFRTIVEHPGQPVLTEPLNISRHIQVNPVLKWRPTERAARYSLQVSARPDFAILLYNLDNLSQPSRQLSGLVHDRTYYWRVRAMNTGGQSAWSAPWQFTTVVAEPEAAVPATPSKFAVDVPVRPQLRWNRGLRAEKYILQLAADAEFTQLLHEKKEIKDTTYVPPALEHEKSYYWRVRPVNRGGIGPWSESLHFSTIIQAPPAPAHVTPDDFLFDVPSGGTLSWNSSPRALQYDVQVSKFDDFSSRDIDTSGVQVLYLDYKGLEGNRTYYWRVRAVNEGGKSPWSEPWSFTTARSSFRGNLPQEVVLQQNHPNPFNPSTQIRYGLPEPTDVRLEVYNTLGQLVSVLVSGQQQAGYHTATFDASNLSNGIYVYRLFVANQVYTKKMTLVK
jgi:large repetitive protein